MVTHSFHNPLNELKDFYSDTLENSDNTYDKESASTGLKTLESIDRFIKKYETKKEKKHLKRIHSLLATLSRGIEFFNDFETNERHNELGIHVYTLREEIEKELNW
ncbi:hypothetical protein ACJD0Z_06965 [Flavobacteriaceae bacterium M23B6Z8]